jgi:hypothetical protein
MSIIYNVTNKVEAIIADDWLKWMMQEHIPEIMATRCFYQYKVVRLLEVDETDGPTYAVQYTAESKADYNRYIEKYAVEMRQKASQKWGEQFIAFGSVMAVVQ